MNDKAAYKLMMKILGDLDFMAKKETVETITQETKFADQLIKMVNLLQCSDCRKMPSEMTLYD